MAENTKRIGDVADILQVSTQTIRNWLRLGDDFFTEAATRQHGKRFAAADLDQLKRIQRLLSEGFILDQIKTMLPAAPQIVDILEDPQPPATDHQPTNAPIEVFWSVTLAAKDETIAILKEENQRLRDEIENLRKPWWRRW